jgi:BRCT domain type II-containing protein
MNENISSHTSERMNMNEGRGTKHDRSDDQYSTTEERAPKLPFSQDIKTNNKNREPKRSPSQDIVAICATTQDKKAIEAPARTRVYARGKKTAWYYLPFETLSTTNAANQMWNKHYQETVAYQPRRITSKCRLMESERRYYDFRFID